MRTLLQLLLMVAVLLISGYSSHAQQRVVAPLLNDGQWLTVVGRSEICPSSTQVDDAFFGEFSVAGSGTIPGYTLSGAPRECVLGPPHLVNSFASNFTRGALTGPIWTQPVPQNFGQQLARGFWQGMVQGVYLLDDRGNTGLSVAEAEGQLYLGLNSRRPDNFFSPISPSTYFYQRADGGFHYLSVDPTRSTFRLGGAQLSNAQAAEQLRRAGAPEVLIDALVWGEQVEMREFREAVEYMRSISADFPDQTNPFDWRNIELAIELQFGVNGEVGVPLLVNGEASGLIKVVLKGKIGDWMDAFHDMFEAGQNLTPFASAFLELIKDRLQTWLSGMGPGIVVQVGEFARLLQNLAAGTPQGRCSVCDFLFPPNDDYALNAVCKYLGGCLANK